MGLIYRIRRYLLYLLLEVRNDFAAEKLCLLHRERLVALFIEQFFGSWQVIKFGVYCGLTLLL